ncbi:MAG: hypothetical protein AAGF23_06090 [Acidobacteriota bacterium]
MPYANTSADEASTGRLAPGASSLEIGRAEAHALARQAWRMGKRAVQLRRFRGFWRRDQERLRSTSPEKLRADQVEKLRRLATFAAAKIPYYRDLFRAAAVRPDRMTRDDLRRLPLLTRDVIRANFPDRLVHPGRRFRPWMLGRTSGSTSESLSFIRPDDRFRRSLYYSVLLRTGGRTDVQVFVLSTPICTPNTCSLTPQDDGHRRLARRLHRLEPIRHFGGMVGLPASAANILTAPDSLFDEIRRQLEDAGPSILVADPVYLGAFARSLKARGLAAPRLGAIISTYELLTPTVKGLLDEVFGAPIAEQYGSSEINDIADMCEAGHLHVRMDEVIVETLRDGRPALPGELARVVVTDLRNFNMPFIRYDIGDVVRVAEEEPCPCGRRSQRLGAVEGRASDHLDVGGRVVTPREIDALFLGVEGLAAYEWRHTGARRFRIALMPDRGSALDLERASAEVEARAVRLLGDVRLRFSAVEEVRPRASNKFRFVHGGGGAEAVRAG